MLCAYSTKPIQSEGACHENTSGEACVSATAENPRPRGILPGTFRILIFGM